MGDRGKGERALEMSSVKTMFRISVISLAIGVVEGWSMYGAYWWRRPLVMWVTVGIGIVSAAFGHRDPKKHLTSTCFAAGVASIVAFNIGEAAGAAVYPNYWLSPGEFWPLFVNQLLLGPG